MQLALSAGKNAIVSKRQKTCNRIQVRENMPMAAKEKTPLIPSANLKIKSVPNTGGMRVSNDF